MHAITRDGVRHSLQRIRLAIIWIVLVTSAASGQGISASSNTINGVIRVFDLDGDELEDRSGVVVFVDGLSDSASYRSVSKPQQISHKGRQFSPSVLPLVRGATVDFLNDDNIFHNVFSLSQTKTFDLGIYPEGTSKLVSFSEPGLVKIHCNIHPRMTSTILVLNNSLFATTDTDGSFEISGIPNGRVTLRVWSEFSEEQSRTVSLSGGQVDESFDIHRTKRFVQHTDKFGKRYRAKY